MRDFIQSQDEEALKSLTHIEFSVSADATKPYDFTLTFHFGPNEFFENNTLVKTYHMKEEKKCTKAEGSDIKWKAGKNLTKKKVEKK